MRKITSVLCLLFCAQILHSHHGPGMRGYNPNKTVAVSGVILKCFDCSNGARGHGIVQVRSDTIVWEITLPDTPALRRAKVDLNKLKKGTPIRISGFAHLSKANDLYATEIMVNGVKIMSPSNP